MNYSNLVSDHLDSCMISCVHGTLGRLDLQCMKRAEGVIEESKAQVSKMKDEEQTQYSALEGIIADLVNQQAARNRQSLAHKASDLAGEAS